MPGTVLCGHLICYIVQTYQNETALIHRLENLHKFILGRHDLIITLFAAVAVKCFRGIHNQCMEEYMRYLARISAHQCFFGGVVFVDRCRHGLVRCVCTAGQEIDCPVIVITVCQKLLPER